MSSASTSGPAKPMRLDIELMELAIAALLRLLVPEHRADAPELVARTAQHAVGDGGAHDAGRGLGAQREAARRPDLEGVHLLLDHVGEFADGALEEPRLLDDGHAHLLDSRRTATSSRTVPSRNCHAPMSAGSTSFMPRTAWMMSAKSSLRPRRPRADDAAGAVDQELRRIVRDHVGGHASALAIHIQRDTGRVAEHHAQRRRARDRTRRSRRADVVEQPLAVRVVDLHPAVRRESQRDIDLARAACGVAASSSALRRRTGQLPFARPRDSARGGGTDSPVRVSPLKARAWDW